MPQQLRLALVGLGFQNRNRHRAGWRFLRFTTIVTVKAPICNVIRIQPHLLSEGASRPPPYTAPILPYHKPREKASLFQGVFGWPVFL